MYEIKNKNMLWDAFQSLTSSFFRSVSVCMHVVLRGNIPLKCHYSLLKYSQKKRDSSLSSQLMHALYGYDI